MSNEIPMAAWNRYQELQAEEQHITKMLDQSGTTVPKLFTNLDSVVINPSNVGTGVLSRMIETDDTVSAAVNFKNIMIQAKIGEYHHDTPAIKKFIQQMLRSMRHPTWAEAKEGMGSAFGYGFSVSEMVFILNGDMSKTVKRIPTYHPATIAFELGDNGDITEDGVLQFVLQNSQFRNPNRRFATINHGFEVLNPFTTPQDRLHPRRIPFLATMGIVRIPRNKIVHHITGHGYNFGNPYGKSPVRTAHLAWQLKNFILKQMGVSAKRFSQPLVIGQAPQGAAKVKFTNTLTGVTETITPQQALLKMLSDRESDDGLVIGPEQDGYKIEVIQSSGTLQDFVGAINALNTWIFRCFLMPSLVMTDGTAGSRALGDKHFQVVDRICEAEAQKFKDVLIHDFIERMILENFGPQDDYGTFQDRPQNLEERIKLGAMFSELIMSGVMKAYVKEDMAFIRESLGLPEDKDKSFDLRDPIEGEVDVEGNPINTSDPVFFSREKLEIRMAAQDEDLKIQAITFDKSKFNELEAMEWLAQNNYAKFDMDTWSDEGKNIATIRGKSEFNSDSFKVTKIKEGVNIVTGTMKHTD